MAVLRFLASIFALVAVVALVTDATPALNGTGPFEASTIVGYWKEFAPASLEAARTSVSQATFPWVWDPLLMSLMTLPTFILFGLLAILCGYLGRRRHQVKVHIN
ncbi:MAG TPA: hypothetical protein VMX97_09095 [Hyphomicrobiaceae bacterium]|nr:hypothetical protein [Hyphomicrobiaceae bacterium]